MDRWVALLPATQSYSVRGPDDVVQRLALVISRLEGMRSIIATWDGFSLSGGGPRVVSGWTPDAEVFRRSTFEPGLKPDYVFFYCTSDSRTFVFDRGAGTRLDSAIQTGTESGRYTYNQFCYRLLTAMALAGVTVSYASDASAWGVKSVLERRCREYESSTGDVVPRPPTEVVAFPGGEQKVVDFLKSHGSLILKPEDSSRARGISIIRPRKGPRALLLRRGRFVMQELIRSPALLNGRKFDLRIHVEISTEGGFRYRLSDANIVRTAVKSYEPGIPDSEICSTSFSKRRGFRPVRYSLEEAAASQTGDGVDWSAVRRSASETVQSFMKAVAWRARTVPPQPALMFWGLDLGVVDDNEGPRTLLLEVNPFPMLYTHDEVFDAQMDGAMAAFFSLVPGQSSGDDRGAGVLESDGERMRSSPGSVKRASVGSTS